MQKLSIPEHINLRREIIPGVGGPELLKILMVCLPVVVCCLAMSKTTQDPMAAVVWLLAGIGWAFISYAFFARFSGKASAWQLLMRQRKYHREQQNYYYKEEEKVYEVFQIDGA